MGLKHAALQFAPEDVFYLGREWGSIRRTTTAQAGQSMNASGDASVIIYMTHKPTLTPQQKEIRTLHARGKTPETIAIRLGMKISKVLMVLAMEP
jgi:DNA-binding CsgD family transcriptional regulator